MTRRPRVAVPGDPVLVRGRLRRARRRRRSAHGQSIAAGHDTLVVAPTGSGKTLAAFLHAIDRLLGTAAPGRAAAPLPGPVRLAAQGPRRRRRAQPAQSPRGHRARGGPAGPALVRGPHRHPHRRHPAGRARPARHVAARHPHHHSRVALPHADVPGPRVPARRRHRDHRRGACGGRHQAGRPPRPVAGAPRPAARPTRPAHRPVRDRQPRRHGRRVHPRRPTGRPSSRRRARRPGTCRSACPSTTWPRSAPRRWTTGRDGRSDRAHVDLAAHRRADRRPHRAAPHDAGLRQLPAPRRAHHRADQRDRGRATARRPDERVDAGPIARAHHGSVSKEQRSLIEEDLKAGRLPAVVATSSLELGIDMGTIDLVVQVETPPSVASGLQRVGRAGHQVGAVSRGIVFPKYRGDLVTATVVTQRMRAGQIEDLRMPRNPLDVVAQQVVACVAMDDWDADDLLALIRRAAPFTTLTDAVFASVLDMLSGRYPSDEFAELRPRLVWDREHEPAHGSPGGAAAGRHQRRHDPRSRPVRRVPGRRAAGRRVGELDEEMVYESRVGDVIALGASSWRIEDITHDRVLVSPAPGQPGRLPFWHGDALGRPAELGRAVGAFVRGLAAAADPRRAGRRCRARRPRDRQPGRLRRGAARRHRITCPATRPSSIERFRDELGDWRVIVHSPYGARVHAPWALALGARIRERDGHRRPCHARRRRHRPAPARHRRRGRGAVRRRAARDRPGRDRGAGHGAHRRIGAVRLPLPGVRGARPAAAPPPTGSAQSAVAAAAAVRPPARRRGRLRLVPDHPRDGPRVPAGRLRRARPARAARPASRDGSVRVHEVATEHPSPFAQSLLFGYVASFLYEGDSPLAERRAQALTLDTRLLAELLGTPELRDLLDLEADRGGGDRTPAARRPAAVPVTSRTLPTCCDCSVRSPTTRRSARGASTRRGSDRLRAERRAIARPDRRSRRHGGHRGRRPAARRPRSGPAGGHSGGAPGARRRPARATSWAASPARTGRSRPPTSPPALDLAPAVRSGGAASGSPRADGSSRAASGPAARTPSTATPRCCGASDDAASPGSGRRSNRCRRRATRPSCRPGRARRAGQRRRGGEWTAASRSSSSWRASRCPRARGRGRSSRPESPTSMSA